MHHLGVPEQVVQSICIPQRRSAEAEPVRVEAELLPGLGVISHAETLAGARGRSVRGKRSPEQASSRLTRCYLVGRWLRRGETAGGALRGGGSVGGRRRRPERAGRLVSYGSSSVRVF